jgi:integrase
MPRPATGSIRVRKSKRGEVYSARFSAYGDPHEVTLGCSADGWTLERAETELRHIVADVERKIWRPRTVAPKPSIDPTFHEYASRWFEAHKFRVEAQGTIDDYETTIRKHLLPHFARFRLSEIRVEHIDSYVEWKVRDRRFYEQATVEERAALPRPLGNRTIKKTLTRLSQILETAVEHELITRNVARSASRRLRASEPTRTYIDTSDQMLAMLAGASAVDARAEVHFGRARAAIATLMFSGLRIGELIDLRRADIDLASQRLFVRRSKTDAGVRTVQLLPVLASELRDYLAARKFEQDALIFGTSKGTPENATNVRLRILAPTVREANRVLAEGECNPLPDKLVPHSMRRTFASLMFAMGHDPRYVMSQMGHKSAGFTLEIYAKTVKPEGDNLERLTALVAGDLREGKWESATTDTASSDLLSKAFASKATPRGGLR